MNQYKMQFVNLSKLISNIKNSEFEHETKHYPKSAYENARQMYLNCINNAEQLPTGDLALFIYILLKTDFLTLRYPCSLQIVKEILSNRLNKYAQVIGFKFSGEWFFGVGNKKINDKYKVLNALKLHKDQIFTTDTLDFKFNQESISNESVIISDEFDAELTYSQISNLFEKNSKLFYEIRNKLKISNNTISQHIFSNALFTLDEIDILKRIVNWGKHPNKYHQVVSFDNITANDEIKSKDSYKISFISDSERAIEMFCNDIAKEFCVDSNRPIIDFTYPSILKHNKNGINFFKMPIISLVYRGKYTSNSFYQLSPVLEGIYEVDGALLYAKDFAYCVYNNHASNLNAKLELNEKIPDELLIQLDEFNLVSGRKAFWAIFELFFCYHLINSEIKLIDSENCEIFSGITKIERSFILNGIESSIHSLLMLYQSENTIIYFDGVEINNYYFPAKQNAIIESIVITQISNYLNYKQLNITDLENISHKDKFILAIICWQDFCFRIMQFDSISAISNLSNRKLYKELAKLSVNQKDSVGHWKLFDIFIHLLVYGKPETTNNNLIDSLKKIRKDTTYLKIVASINNVINYGVWSSPFLSNGKKQKRSFKSQNNIIKTSILHVQKLFDFNKLQEDDFF